MALIYNIEKDIRYNQGLEQGLVKGIKKGRIQRSRAVAINLLRETDLSNEKIAGLVDIPLKLVIDLRKQVAQ